MKVFGVNYGNRFVPEDWMFKSGPDNSDELLFRGCSPICVDPNNENRKCLACLPQNEFEDRYLSWLDKHIKDTDFEQMATMGVNVVRVPCGYWNWVTYPDGSTPDGVHPDRMRVLQTIKPERYQPYFDRVFDSAKKHGIKILLDLHALPGSQNGEMHSGLTAPHAQFNTDWNKKKAVEAVEQMAKYCRKRIDTLYGLQVINEPNGYGKKVDPHVFLYQYYKAAIKSARKHLPKDIPIIVFEWTYNFKKWKNDRFPYDKYGNVIWDTHIYHLNPGDPSVIFIQDKYWDDLCAIKSFHENQSGGVMVGEWSLAGPTWSKEKNEKFVQWIVWSFMERCHGCIFWNWDCDITEWSFQKCATNIDWKNVPKPI